MNCQRCSRCGKWASECMEMIMPMFADSGVNYVPRAIWIIDVMKRPLRNIPPEPQFSWTLCYKCYRKLWDILHEFDKFEEEEDGA